MTDPHTAKIIGGLTAPAAVTIAFSKRGCVIAVMENWLNNKLKYF